MYWLPVQSDGSGGTTASYPWRSLQLWAVRELIDAYSVSRKRGGDTLLGKLR